ncbi:hypothetical protein QTP88_025333 [Uroleucon formosanum]
MQLALVVVIIPRKVFTLLFGRRATACASSEKRGRRLKGQLRRARRTTEQRDSCFIPLFLFIPISEKLRPANLLSCPTQKKPLYTV